MLCCFLAVTFSTSPFASLTMHKAAGLKQKLIKVCMGTCARINARIYMYTHISKYALRKERMQGGL